MIVATRKGVIKKTAMSEFEVVRRQGLIAMNLDEDDELIGAKLARIGDDVLLVSAQGRSIRFCVDDLRLASRTSGGVRGIHLDEDDSLASLNLVHPDDQSELLIVTEKGFGKRTLLQEYPRHHRGGKGITTSKINEKTGLIATARVVTEHDNDLMIISASGVVIRTEVNNVRIAGRVTQGVTLMRLNDGDAVVAIATTNGKKPDATDEAENTNNYGEEMNDVTEEEIIDDNTVTEELES
jgi:DNA gyrase subunit A